MDSFSLKWPQLPCPRTHRMHWVMPHRPPMSKEFPPHPQQVAWCSCQCSPEPTAGHLLFPLLETPSPGPTTLWSNSFKTQLKCPLCRGSSEDTADAPLSISTLPKSLLSFLPWTYPSPIPQVLFSLS